MKTTITFEDVAYLGRGARDFVIDEANKLGVRVVRCIASDNILVITDGEIVDENGITRTVHARAVASKLKGLKLPETAYHTVSAGSKKPLNVTNAMATYGEGRR